MPHANARTNVYARRLMVERVDAGWPPAHVAEQLGVSRPTVDKWVKRFREAGQDGLHDRSSRPHSSPNRTPAKVEKRVLSARRRRQRGAVVLAAELGMHASTVGRVLARHRVPHLAAVDPITGAPVRSMRHSGIRYEHAAPGDLIHVDVKKLGRIPAGGGWRAHGRSEAVRGRGNGYDYIHTAIDDHTRLAYSEIHPDEKDATAAGFLHRALECFAAHGITVLRVLTDNALVYRRGRAWAEVCQAWSLKRRFIKPRCPWTNGKVCEDFDVVQRRPGLTPAKV